MSKFSSQIKSAVAKAKRTERLLYKATVNHAFRSIRFGSTVTAAPGQPVDSGELLKSWKLRMLASRNASMESTLPYAPIIEDNRRGARLRSAVGGFHSVRYTRLGWNRIVAHELGRIKGGGTGEPDGAPTLRVASRGRDARSGRFTGNETRVNIDG